MFNFTPFDPAASSKRYLETLASESTVLLFSVSAFAHFDKFAAFVSNAADFLGENKITFYILHSTITALKEFEKIPGKAENTRKALIAIDFLKEKGFLRKIKCSNQKINPDLQVIETARSLRNQRNLVVVTQSADLAQTIESEKLVPVRRINKYGYISKFVDESEAEKKNVRNLLGL